jgi:hypothetical protein
MSVVGIYLIGWFVVLGVALLTGSLEWGVRRLRTAWTGTPESG